MSTVTDNIMKYLNYDIFLKVVVNVKAIIYLIYMKISNVR